MTCKSASLANCGERDKSEQRLGPHCAPPCGLQWWTTLQVGAQPARSFHSIECTGQRCVVLQHILPAVRPFCVPVPVRAAQPSRVQTVQLIRLLYSAAQPKRGCQSGPQRLVCHRPRFVEQSPLVYRYISDDQKMRREKFKKHATFLCVQYTLDELRNHRIKRMAYCIPITSHF